MSHSGSGKNRSFCWQIFPLKLQSYKATM